MKKIILAALLCLVASSAFAQKPPINGVAGPTTSAQIHSIITDPSGSGQLTFDNLIPGVTTLSGSSLNSNGLFYNSGSIFTNLASANSGVLVTSGGGVPSISTTLPTNLTQTLPLTFLGSAGRNWVWSDGNGNGEVLLATTSRNNVIAIQNNSPSITAGYAVVAMRDNTGYEQGANGCSQTGGTGNIFPGQCFNESSGTFDPALFGQVPNGWLQFQTGPFATTANAFTAMSWTASVVTATTTTAHGIAVGATIDVTGVTPSGYTGRYVTVTGTTGSTIKYALVSNPGPVTIQGAVNTSRNWPRIEVTKDQNSDINLWAITSAAGVNNKRLSVYGSIGTVGIGDAVASERANATFPVNIIVTGQNVQRFLSSGHRKLDVAWNSDYSLLQFIDTDGGFTPFSIGTGGNARVEVAGGGIRFNGGTSGFTAVIPQGIASGSLSLPSPASTDNLIAANVADTLTNKTMNGSANTFSNIALSSLATQATNTITGNATAGSASPTALAIGSCSGATSALTWTTNSGFGCHAITPGTGTVTSVSVTTANGVSGSVANPTTTPAITLTLGAITPSSINASGTVTFADTSAWATTGLTNSQTYSTSSTSMFSLTPTWNFSSTAANWRAVNIVPTVVPTGASGGDGEGVRIYTNMGTSAVNVSTARGVEIGMNTNAGYTGTIANSAALNLVSNTNGSLPITSAAFLTMGSLFNGNGITSGNIFNTSIIVNNNTASPAAGGTINNAGINIVVPTGSGAGTTQNVALSITGNGGSGGGGTTTNYAIQSSSTAQSSLAGPFLLPNITADTALTDNTVCITSSGQLYKGSGALGTCLGTSSLRYKTHVQDATDGLLKVAALQPKTFFYKKGYGDDGARKQFGFLAEDVVEIIPGLVTADNDGRPNTVDLLGMVPMMVTAIKELKASNDNLRQDIQLLKTSGRK